MAICSTGARLTASCFRAGELALKAADLPPEHRGRFRLNSQRQIGFTGQIGFIGTGRGFMPLALAEYLRHLATRCSRMSRDCNDPVTSKELVIISVELVEKAEAFEAENAIPLADDPRAAEITTRDQDDEK
jgi:hypothetical protein